MQSSMAMRLPPTCRLAQDDLNDTCRNVIEAIFTAVMTRTVVCAVWDSLTAVATGPKPKDNGWKTSEVQLQKATAIVVTAKAMLRME